MFAIDATEAGKGQLDVKVTGPLSLYTGEKTFTVIFVVTQLGNHKVEVL